MVACKILVMFPQKKLLRGMVGEILVSVLTSTNLTTIGSAVSENIIQATEHFFRTLGVMKRQENMNVTSRPMNSITTLFQLTLGK